MPVQKVRKTSGAVVVQPSKELEYLGHEKGHTKKFTKESTEVVKNKKGRRTTVITNVREVKQVVTTTALEDSFSSDDEEYSDSNESGDDDDDDEEEKGVKTHRKPKTTATVKPEKENYARQLAELIKTFVRGVSDAMVSELNSGCLRGVSH